MRYQGGKFRLRKHIVPLIDARLSPGQTYWEPFLGGANILPYVRSDVTRIGSDTRKDLVELYKAVQAGWEPPEHVTREEYIALRYGPRNTALSGFASTAWSFCGTVWSSYVTVEQAKRVGQRHQSGPIREQLIAQIGGIDATFLHSDFLTCEFEGVPDVIYCDPPYAGTAAYAGAKFDHAAFWERCRYFASLGAEVLVSESTGPSDAKVVFEKPGIGDMQGKDGKRKTRTEYVFVLTRPKSRGN